MQKKVPRFKHDNCIYLFFILICHQLKRNGKLLLVALANKNKVIQIT